MAEAVLGAVAGSFGVASLAIQLIDVAQKLHDFWDTLEAANSNVERIKDHLSVMQTISLSIIDISSQESNVAGHDGVAKSLCICKARTERLSNQINGLASGGDKSSSKKILTSVKTALKDKTIRKIESQLRGDVMMLLLAIQPLFHYAQSLILTSIDGRISQLALSLPPGADVRESDGNKSPSIDPIAHSQKSGKSELSSEALVRIGLFEWPQLQNHRVSIKFDANSLLKKLIQNCGITLPSPWKKFIEDHPAAVTYTSVELSNYNGSLIPGDHLYSNMKRRLKVILPLRSFQIQTSSVPWSLTSYPISPCQSHIFTLCADGNLDTVKHWFKNSGVSPFVVNQHGENLLHAAARYANADICNFLLDIGVDGSTYDDRLLTPLDHLARKVCTSFAYPTRVVNTIRALVERGRCQPLMPVTSNAVAFYRGPKEGFSWLFASEYAGVNPECLDSEGWTLLNDAAFNFGWWTQLCVDVPAVSWQSLYLLRAGADPHAKTAESGLTPLDTFLCGSTAHFVNHAAKWLQVLKESGIDLHEYGKTEQEIHAPEHYLKSTWDEELWKWIPTKRKVIYQYGKTSSELDIWLEDYDALGWFQCGRYDLEIFKIYTISESIQRWKEMNARDDTPSLDTVETATDMPRTESPSRRMIIHGLLQSHWFQFFVLSLVCNYVFHVYLLQFY